MNTATTSQLGAVKPDGTTIGISSGIISAIGASPTGSAGGRTGTWSSQSHGCLPRRPCPRRRADDDRSRNTDSRVPGDRNTDLYIPGEKQERLYLRRPDHRPDGDPIRRDGWG